MKFAVSHLRNAAFKADGPRAFFAYRDLGIFYENAVNRILQDVVKACKPVWAKVTGTFAARGGLSSKIEARYP